MELGQEEWNGDRSNEIRAGGMERGQYISRWVVFLLRWQSYMNLGIGIHTACSLACIPSLTISTRGTIVVGVGTCNGVGRKG